MTLSDPRPAGRPARRRSSTSCSGTGPCRAHAASSSFIVGAGRGHDLPAIVDRFVELAAQTASTRSPRCAVGGAARRRAAGNASRRRLVAGDRQAGRGQGHRRRDRARRHRRPHRRHRHRRHRPSPSRSVEGAHLMAELTINADEIAAALRKHVEGFKPDDRERAGRPGARGRRRHRPRRRACPTPRSTSCSSSRAARSASR